MTINMHELYRLRKKIQTYDYDVGDGSHEAWDGTDFQKRRALQAFLVRSGAYDENKKLISDAFSIKSRIKLLSAMDVQCDEESSGGLMECLDEAITGVDYHTYDDDNDGDDAAANDLPAQKYMIKALPEMSDPPQLNQSESDTTHVGNLNLEWTESDSDSDSDYDSADEDELLEIKATDELKTNSDPFEAVGPTWGLARVVMRRPVSKTWCYASRTTQGKFTPACMFMVDQRFVQRFDNYASLERALTRQKSHKSQNAKISCAILTFGSNMKKLDDDSELHVIWYHYSSATLWERSNGKSRGMPMRMIGFPVTDIHNTSSDTAQGRSKGRTEGVGMFVVTSKPVTGHAALKFAALPASNMADSRDSSFITPDRVRAPTPSSPPPAPKKLNPSQGASRDRSKKHMIKPPTEAPGAPMKAPRASEVYALPPKEALDGYANEELRKLAHSRKLEWYGTREDVVRVLEEWRRNTAFG